jgi:hypothetical protein
MKTITIEQLAEKINGKLWTKGEMKRIYVDAGYNTKKMTTKTYIYQREDGTFGVSCYIDCPSQAWQWIKSQQEEVIEGVERQIANAISDTAYLMTNKEGVVVNSSNEPVALNYAEYFYNEDQAIKELDNCPAYHGYTTMPKDEFEAEVTRLDEIEMEANRQKQAANPAPTPATTSTGLKIENTDTPFYGVGAKVKHGKFGEGEVLAESNGIVEIKFASETKQLLKAYAKLEKL